MARDFDGSNDKITFTAPALASTITLSFICTLDTIGSNFTPRPFACTAFNLSFSDDGTIIVPFGKTLRFTSIRSGGGSNDGIWYTAANIWSYATQYRVVVTYDGSSTLNAPTVYLNGTSFGTTIESVPSGSIPTNTTAVVGDHLSLARPFDGRISEVGVWDRILSAGEINALSVGASPRRMSANLKQYYPLIGRHTPEIDHMSANTGTVAGAVVADHPGVIYIMPPIEQKWVTPVSMAVFSEIHPRLAVPVRRRSRETSGRFFVEDQFHLETIELEVPIVAANELTQRRLQVALADMGAGEEVAAAVGKAGPLSSTNTTTTLGFFGVTPVARATAYTQTYATADKTHAAPTAVTVTHAVGTADGTVEDVTGSFSQTVLNNNFKELTTQTNALIADLADLKQLVNSLIDDLQAYGLAQ